MKLLFTWLLISLAFFSYALGDSNAGQNKAILCAACHGQNGQSINPAWPNLASQHAHYLAQQLQHYKAGTQRNSPVMAPLVANLSAEDIADLAAFYAKMPPAPKQLSKENARGKQLYRQGNIDLQIPACMTCHGPDGRGAEQAGFPMISHQQPDYIVQQLQAFKAGTRSSDPFKIMRTLCAKLSPEDMQAVAQYLGQL